MLPVAFKKLHHPGIINMEKMLETNERVSRRKMLSESLKRICLHPFITFTQMGRGQAQVDSCRGGQLHVDVHRKLESIDVILSVFHAKSLAFFVPEFRLWAE